MIRCFSTSKCVLMAAVVALQLSTAYGGGILLSEVRDITIQQFFRDAPGSHLVNIAYTNGVNASEDFVDAASENLFQAPFGYTGLVLAFQESSYLPSQPSVGNDFNGLLFTGTGRVDSTITESNFRNDDIANSRAIVRFSVDTPTRWNWDAEIFGEASGDVQSLYYFGVLDPVSGNPFFEDVRTDDFSQIVSQTGMLAPGEYELTITARATSSRQLTAGNGAGFVLIEDGQFTLTAVPEPGSLALLLSLGGFMALVSRRSWGATYTAGDGNDVALFTAVQEPAGVVLVAFVLLGVGARGPLRCAGADQRYASVPGRG